MPYNSSAWVYVVNNTRQTADFWIKHKYSSDLPIPEDGDLQEIYSGGVPNGQATKGLQVGFNLNQPGLDWWFVAVKLANGQILVSNDKVWKECMLQSEDDGKELYFMVDTDTLTTSLLSGWCQTDMGEDDDADFSESNSPQPIHKAIDKPNETALPAEEPDSSTGIKQFFNSIFTWIANLFSSKR